jgi:hypothetical protein
MTTTTVVEVMVKTTMVAADWLLSFQQRSLLQLPFRRRPLM